MTASDVPPPAPQNARIVPPSIVPARIVAEDFAGMRAQGFGLAARAGFESHLAAVEMRPIFRRIPQRFWPRALSAVTPIAASDAVLIGVGGLGGRVARALSRRDGAPVVQVQNPRLPLRHFNVVVANVHDEIRGRNVVRVRNALHGVTPERLAEARAHWQARLRVDDRPLVSVLVGGANGRFSFGATEAVGLGSALRSMMKRDRVRVVLTPSRRTDSHAVEVLRAALLPLGGVVWDGQGENPYLGLLACADMIVVTMDSVSMVSEAVATQAPVMIASLPGASRRIGLFHDVLRGAGRVRPLGERFEQWRVEALDDTPHAAEEVRARLGLARLEPCQVKGEAG